MTSWGLRDFVAAYQPEILDWLWTHTWMSVAPVLIGLALALPLGWLARRSRLMYEPIRSVTGLLYTVPALALFVLIPPLLGLEQLSPLQVPIAATLLSVALLVRVVAEGLASVPSDTRQAATALGYRPAERFWSVELPIAVPAIAAGLRVAVVTNVAIVAVAGAIGLANLGPLFDPGLGLSVNGYPPILLGIALCALLALALDLLILGTNRLLTPWRRADR